MRIPDWVRKCLAFVGYADTAGNIYLAGSAFLVHHQAFEDGTGFAYLVTAKHVIDGIRNKGCDTVQLRFEFSGEAPRWLPIPIDRWYFHPDKENIDVAVISISGVVRIALTIEPFSMDARVTPDRILEHSIGVGTEVFLSGLFVNHYGRERNIPIVRVGNIAAMPEEKIQTKMGPMDAYLIEARSIGGLSGSPVFAHLGVVIRPRSGGLAMSTDDSGLIFFLGLMHGHWDAPGLTTVDEASLDARTTEERVNMGIGIVVPAEKVMEVIRQPKLRALEEAAMEKERLAKMPVIDSPSPDEI